MESAPFWMISARYGMIFILLCGMTTKFYVRKPNFMDLGANSIGLVELIPGPESGPESSSQIAQNPDSGAGINPLLVRTLRSTPVLSLGRRREENSNRN